MVVCPIECVKSACPDADFIEKNGTWLLTIIGLISACVGSVFAYFLKSRCKRIYCCGMGCDREVVALEAKDFKEFESAVQKDTISDKTSNATTNTLPL